MCKWRPWWIKCKQWIKHWRSCLYEQLAAPLTEPTAQIQVITIVILLFFIWPSKGYEIWRQEVSHTLDALELFALAYVFYALLSAVMATFRTSKSIKELGQWHGNRFVYHSPQLVATYLISPEDNEKTQLFKVHDPEADSLVEVDVKIDSSTDRTKAQVIWPTQKKPSIDWRVNVNAVRQSLRLPANHFLGLRTYAIPETSPTAVRVYILSWQI